MTKQWEQYEEVIKQLYAESTLAEVRKTMSEKYNFNASIRAYRGRLIKWNFRKYNCRKKDLSESNGSPTSRTSVSPTRWPSTDLYSYPDPNAPNVSPGSYDHRGVNNYQNFPERAPIFPEWASTTAQPATPIPAFGHDHTNNMPNVSRPMSGSSPISPTSCVYSSAPNTPSSAPNFYTTILYAPTANSPPSQQPATTGYPPTLFPMYGTPQSDRDRRSSAPQMPTTTTHPHHHQYSIGTYDGYPPATAPYHSTTAEGVYSPPQDHSSPDHDIVYHSPTTTTQGTPAATTPGYQRVPHHHQRHRHRIAAGGKDRKKGTI